MRPVGPGTLLLCLAVILGTAACGAVDAPADPAVPGVRIESRVEVLDDRIDLHYGIRNDRDVALYVFAQPRPGPACEPVPLVSRAYVDVDDDTLVLRLAMPQAPAGVEMAEVPMPRAVRVDPRSDFDASISVPLPAVVDDPIRQAIAAASGLRVDQTTRQALATAVSLQIGFVEAKADLSTQSFCPGTVDVWPPGLITSRTETLTARHPLPDPVPVRTYP